MPENPKKNKANYSLFVILALVIGALALTFVEKQKIPRITEQELFEKIKRGEVKKMKIKQGEGQVQIFAKHSKKSFLSRLLGWNNPDFVVLILDYSVFNANYKEAKREYPILENVPYSVEESGMTLGRLLYMFFFYFLTPLLLLFYLFSHLGGNNMGSGGVFGLGKTKAKFWSKEDDTGISFDDVIGIAEPKQEIMEVVEFLTKSSKFDDMGAQLPKGVLLEGPPGTGKTLLARAVAHTAGVPFLYTSGPDFIDMFVGVGVMRVQSLFLEARKHPACIIFIDEIDAIGRKRTRSNMTSNQDGDNTLNQFLAEMDGLKKDQKIIIIGATNRARVMDPALLRPGRFDRKVHIGLPRIDDRKALFKYFIAKLPKIAKNINIQRLAELTALMSPAAIQNICNEAAILAVRQENNEITMKHIEASIDREIGGIEKKSMRIKQEEKEIVAHHEAGHAIVGWFSKYADPLVKVSIIPRGEAALGFAQYQPEERVIYQENQFADELAVFFGGRAAEKIIYNQFSTGASNDLERATKIVRDNIEHYGMSEVVGHISYPDASDAYQMRKPYSEETAIKIDQETKRLLDEAYKKALDILTTHKGALEEIAQLLIKKEVLYKKDLVKILGPSPFEKEKKAVAKKAEKSKKIT